MTQHAPPGCKTIPDPVAESITNSYLAVQGQGITSFSTLQEKRIYNSLPKFTNRRTY